MEEELKEAEAQAAAETLRADNAESALSESQSRVATLEGELRGVNAELANLKKERADVDVEKLKLENTTLKKQLRDAQKARQDALTIAPKALEKAVKERVKLLSEAQEVLGDVKLDELTDREIRIKVIERLDGPVESSAHEAFVSGCYTQLVKGHFQGQAALAAVSARRDSVATKTVTEERVDTRDPREKFLAEQNNACKIG